MGKNYSCNNTGKRKESDFYETPYSLTRLLLDEVTLQDVILEPACGSGAIVKVLEEYNYRVLYNDLNTGTGKDFLDRENYRSHEVKTIITNPPYSLAHEFILRAKELTVIGVEEIFMLLPLSYLHGKKRYDEIWTDYYFPLTDVYIFTRYPLLGEILREDGKHHTGMMVYAWYKWQKDEWYSRKDPKIHWLDNNPYILKAGE